MKPVSAVNEMERVAAPPASKLEAPTQISENGLEVLRRRYLRKGPDGTPIETVPEMFWRVASNVALPERAHGGEEAYQATAEEFYDLLNTLRFFPNSPTFTGAGTPLGQLAACFVLAIDDDMGKDSSEGIFNTLRNAALIQQTGGGNGFSFSRLRPRGGSVNSSAGVASGPVGFLKVYDAAFGEIAQGGCLTSDSLVFTSNGLLRLDELVDQAHSGWQEHSLSVPTDDGKRTSPRGFNNGVQPVMSVQTREGLSLTGTLNHKVKVMTGEGPAWRRLDELTPGDAILVMLGQHQGRLRALRRPIKTHGNQAEIGLPSILDETLAFVLGYLAGDGFVAADPQDHRIGFSVAHDSYLLDELPPLLQQVFPGCKVHRQQKADDASVTYVVDSAILKQFMVDNGFAKLKSHEVTVPRLVRQSPATIAGAYLRGLFEADGGLSHGYPQLNTTSQRLAQEVATLLIGLGCPVTIRSTDYSGRLGKRPQWIVRISSHVGLEAWRQRIGCDQRSRFVTSYAFRPDTERESSYALPAPAYWLQPVLDDITLPQIDRQSRGQGVKLRATDPQLRKKLLRYLRGGRQLTMSAYREFGTEYSEFAEHARSVQNLWFVHVAETHLAGEQMTLDLEVDGNHTYLANGLVTHNTRRGANMGVLRVDHPDIEEFIACKAKEGQIANFNISVGVTDAFMEAVKADTEYDLINPHTKKVTRSVRARDIFDKISHYAHRNGEPGVLFLDAANRSNPVPHLYELEATNPCTTGDTPVATPAGWRRADEIKVGDEIHTVAGVGRVARVEINHNVLVYRVTFADGGSIRATAAHQFHEWDRKTGQFSPKRLDQLTIGSEVRFVRPMPLQMPAAALAMVGGGPLMERSAVLEQGSGVVGILSITPDSVETVYDLFEPTTDTWITAGYVSRGCGEQFLGPYENCCLGSINLAQHVTDDGKIDWAKLEKTVVDSTRFLDDVVSANKYVPAVPQLQDAAHRVRRIGLGIMGLADVMYRVGVRYGDQESLDLAGQVMEFVRYHCMRTSIDLARERGPFLAIEGSIYDPNDLMWQPPSPLDPFAHGFGRPALDWDAIVEGIKAHGIRNGAQTTVAPTGCLVSGSMVTTDQGVLPIESLGDVRGERWQDIDVLVASEGANSWATKFYVNGRAHTLRAMTKRGYVLQGTDQHRIRVWQDGAWVWQRMDELRPGMKVPLQPTGLIGEPQRVTLDTRLQTDFHATPVTLPTEITADLAYLIGFFMGDGSLKDRSLRFAISDAASEVRITSLIRSLFGADPTILKDSRSASLRSVELHSRNVVSFWINNGLAKNRPSADHSGKGYQPFIPLAVLRTNDADVYGAFLAGLFDADGTVHRGQLVTWLTTDRLFHDQVKALLLVLGVLTTSDLQTTGLGQSTSYRLRTSHADAAKKLMARLPYLCRLHADQNNVRRTTLGDTIPLTREEYVTLLAVADSGREEHRVWGWRQSDLTASRDSLARFVNQHRSDLMTVGLQHLVTSVGDSIFYDELVAIEDGDWQETYDLSVPGPHAYIANGFVSHNTIGTVTGCEGYGCEPVFALAYTRYVKEAGGDVALTYVSPLFIEALDRAGITGERRERIVEQIVLTGTCQGVDELPQALQHTFVVSQDITAEQHVLMQAALQCYVDNSISKTINCPPDATPGDIKQVYMQAWELGCKGLTVYVTGSRQEVVLETKATADAKKAVTAEQVANGHASIEETLDAVPHHVDIQQPNGTSHHAGAAPEYQSYDIKRPRPKRLHGATYRRLTPLGTAYVTVNDTEEGEPFEVFMNVGKAGSDVAAVSEALGRLISLALRMPSSLSPTERLQQVVYQLNGIGGGRHLGFGPQRVRSLPDAIAQVLAEHLEEVPAPATYTEQPAAEQLALPIPRQIGDLCPDCGNSTLLNIEGCRKCHVCGYSEC